MGEKVKQVKLAAADALTAAIPCKVPERAALEKCKIISHRGEHDNKQIFENTLPAFEKASSAGVWGIECDIRWTADLEPVVFHDPTAARVFGQNIPINQLPLSDLKIRFPQIPTLAELVATLGGKNHLMLEFKAENFPDLAVQRRRLQEILARLTPGDDFHALALDPDIFRLVDFLPSRACVLVAVEHNVRQLCQSCLDNNYGGMGGHFLLLNNRIRDALFEADQQMGTGFVASRNCLFRELNRSVEWIFTNRAIKLQSVRDHYLSRQQ